MKSLIEKLELFFNNLISILKTKAKRYLWIPILLLIYANIGLVIFLSLLILLIKITMHLKKIINLITNNNLKLFWLTNKHLFNNTLIKERLLVNTLDKVPIM